MLVGNMGWTRVRRDVESDELFIGCIYQNYSVEYLLYLCSEFSYNMYFLIINQKKFIIIIE